MEYTLKAGDTKPLRVTLERGDETPIPLAGGTVRFQMWTAGLPNAPAVIDALATILEGTPDPDRPGRNFGTGVVEYAWGPGQTVRGLYYSRWQITDAAGEVQSVPNEGWFTVRIE